MKKLLIAGNVAYPTTAASYNAVGAGALAIFNKGTFIAAPTGTGDPVLAERIELVLGRAIADGGPEVIDFIYLRNLATVKSVYVAATTFAATVTVPTVVVDEDYTIIVAKKGVVLNERNTYTATVRSVTGDTATTIATKLVAQINNQTRASDVTAANTAGAITVTAVNAGEDYTLVPADAMVNIALTSVTQGIPAVNDAAFVEDLARRCAGAKGVIFTYDGGGGLYKNYPINVSGTFTIYTLTFENPKLAGTTSGENVRQIVHIAVPTGAAQIATLDLILALDRTY